jgi:cytochrome c55X
MRRRHLMKWTVELGLGLVILVWATTAAADTFRIPDAARQQELVHLLQQDLGACHGLYLTGGLGPALRPQDLRGKPVESLREVILRGRPGTPMPGWQAFITESEAGWMVQTLLIGLPDEKGLSDGKGLPYEKGLPDDH